MDPLLLVHLSGEQQIETPEYTGDVLVVTLQIPISRRDDIDRNDTLRREVTAAIVAAFPPPDAPGV